MQISVITTINPPSDTVKKLVTIKNMKVVVVGDKKTPENWNHPKVEYLSYVDQSNQFRRLSELLPFNHYGRKNIGYILAINQNPEHIIDFDDDNVPTSKLSQGILPPICELETIMANEPINMYQFFTKRKVWPRGYPLSLLGKPQTFTIQKKIVKPYIQQLLANIDPDVDAIYRLFDSKKIIFKNRAPIAISPNSYSPINSQATIWYKDIFPLLYFPTSVAWRAADIWRGYIAQKIVWTLGGCLTYTPGLVYQKRNFHTFQQDFADELFCYQNTDKLLEVLGSCNPEGTITEKLVYIYELLAKNDLVFHSELPILEAWLKEIH